jgi:hypothetical protein
VGGDFEFWGPERLQMHMDGEWSIHACCYHASSGFLGESIDKRNKKYPESLVKKISDCPILICLGDCRSCDRGRSAGPFSDVKLI